MTDEEARKKWCPYLGAVLLDEDVRETRCMASDCMAWRWDYERGCGGRNDPDGPSEGYCGLAGKP